MLFGKPKSIVARVSIFFKMREEVFGESLVEENRKKLELGDDSTTINKIPCN